MRILLSVLLFPIILAAYGQHDFSNDNFIDFNSSFQKLAKGKFKGFADGLLQFENIDGKILSVSFSKDSAYLDIVADKNDVYDVSSKNYSVKTGDTQIKYSTYFRANALFVTIGNNIYTLSLFDGSCSGVIKGLDYEYIPNGEAELLIIHFSDKVGLCATNCYTSPVFFVLKGSTLIFHIKK